MYWARSRASTAQTTLSAATHQLKTSQGRAYNERYLELRLARELRRLDRYACVCLDDIGYVRQDRAEMEVLFSLLAERYERRSVMITSNLVFSQWNQIFHDDMTAAAAIDRVVHHSVMLELTVASYRAEAARARTRGEGA